MLDNVKTRLERRLNTFSVRNEPREVHLAYSKSKKRSPLVIIESQRSVRNRRLRPPSPSHLCRLPPECTASCPSPPLLPPAPPDRRRRSPAAAPSADDWPPPRRPRRPSSSQTASGQESCSGRAASSQDEGVHSLTRSYNRVTSRRRLEPEDVRSLDSSCACLHAVVRKAA